MAKDASGPVYTLLPTFRLPILIHSRTANAKSLYEIAHQNPLWVNPVDAERLGNIRTGDLLKVHTEIGSFALHAWITEGLTPGVVACSHHLGRWRVNKEDQIERISSAWVDLKEIGKGQWKMRQIVGVEPYESGDPNTQRVWWSEAGVHQNITFPVHPDPISGMHLAPGRTRRTSRSRRPLRRHLRGHEPRRRRLPEMEGPRPPGPRTRQPASPLVASSSGAVRPAEAAYYIKK